MFHQLTWAVGGYNSFPPALGTPQISVNPSQMSYHHNHPVGSVCCTCLSSNYLHLEAASCYPSSAEFVVECVEPQRAICAGQVAAFYKGDECLGSAVIAGNDHLGQRGAFASADDGMSRRAVT